MNQLKHHENRQKHVRYSWEKEGITGLRGGHKRIAGEIGNDQNILHLCMTMSK